MSFILAGSIAKPYMKHIALFSLIILLAFSACDRSDPGLVSGLPSPTAAKTPDTSAISDKKSPIPLDGPGSIDFNVKNVRLGTGYANVITSLGKPAKSRKVKKDYCGEETHLMLDYPGLKLDLTFDSEGGEFAVFEIEVTSEKLLVEPGISIGHDMGAVRAKLGTPEKQYEEEDFEIMYYPSRGNDLADLYFLNGKLVKIKLWVNPC